MTPTRRSLAIASLLLTPLALAGCDKPNPGATAWSGTASEHQEALCWQRDSGAALGPTQCAQDLLASAAAGEGIPRLEVAPGATVGISVDPVVADTGWTVQAGGQTLASGLTETYYRFTFPEQATNQPPDGYTLQVIAEAEGGSGSRGFWFFQLVPR